MERKTVLGAAYSCSAPSHTPFPLQCGVPGPAGRHGPHAQPRVVAATTNAHGPAPAPHPPQARISVSGCTRRRHCVPHRPAQVLSASSRGWERHGAHLPQLGAPRAVNRIPTHHPQKAGRCGLSGVHVLRTESKAAAGAVRSSFQGPALVLGTAARTAPAPTVKFPVGPRACTFTPALPSLSPQPPFLSEVFWREGAG